MKIFTIKEKLRVKQRLALSPSRSPRDSNQLGAAWKFQKGAKIYEGSKMFFNRGGNFSVFTTAIDELLVRKKAVSDEFELFFNSLHISVFYNKLPINCGRNSHKEF